MMRRKILISARIPKRVNEKITNDLFQWRHFSTGPKYSVLHIQAIIISCNFMEYKITLAHKNIRGLALGGSAASCCLRRMSE